MADVEKTIDIIFGAIDNTATGLTSIGGQLSAFTSGVEGATQPFADITSAIVKIDLAVAALGVTFGAVALNQAGQFRDATNEIYTLIDASPEQFGDFQKAILDYSTGSTQSLGDITTAVYSAISAGVDWNQVIGDTATGTSFLSDAEKAAVAGKTDLNTAVTLLAGSMNAYGGEVDSVSGISDVLFTTVKLGQTTFSELAASMATVTPTAAALGVPIETLGAAIATLTQSGVPTSQAITSINQALLAIASPSTQAATLADELGIKFNAQALEAEGLQGVLQSVASATGGNVDQMTTLFGSVEALKAVLILAANDGAAFEEALQAMANAAGATEAAYAKMADNFGLANQSIINGVTAVLVSAGTPLLDQYGDITGAIGGFLGAVATAFQGDTFQPIYDALSGFGTSVEQFFTDLAANLPAALEGINFTPITTALGTLGGSVSDLFGDLDLTSVNGLHDAIQFVVDAIGSLITTSAGIVSGIGPFFEAVAGAVGDFSALSSETQLLVGNVLGFATGINTAIGYLDGLGPALEGIGVAITTVAGANGIGALVSGLASAGTSATTLSGALGNAGLLGAIGGISYAVTSWADANNNLVPGVDSVGTKVYEVVKNVKDFVAEAASGEASTSDWGTALSTLAGFISPVVSGATALTTGMKGLFDNTEEQTEATKDLGTEIDGLQTAQENATTSTTDLNTEVGLTADQFDELVENRDDISGVFSDVDTEAGNAATSLGDVDTNAGDATAALAEIAEDGGDAGEALAGIVTDGSSAATELGNVDINAANAATALGNIDENAADASESLGGVGTAAGTAGTAIGATTTSIDGYSISIGTAADGTTTFTQLDGAFSGAEKNKQTALKDTEKALLDYETKMEEIASNERIQTLSLSVDLQVTQLQENTKQVVSAFETIQSVVGDTTSLLGGLYDTWADASRFEQLYLEDAIDQYNDILKQQIEEQQKLDEAVIKNLNAQTERFKSDKALIEITGDGLEIELEAFMWKILEKIQIKATEEGADYLLGLAS